MAERAMLFIDGNNWYHALRDAGRGNLGMLNYAKVSSKLVGRREWLGTRYYIGHVKQEANSAMYADQERFLSRLARTDPRITVHLGRLETRPARNAAADDLAAYLGRLTTRIDAKVYKDLAGLAKRARSARKCMRHRRATEHNSPRQSTRSFVSHRVGSTTVCSATPAAAIIELKDWVTRGDQPGSYEGLIKRQGAQELHPSDQVRGYTEYCRRFHSAVADHGAAVHGCVLFTRDSWCDAYAAAPNEQLAADYPLFTTATEDVERAFPAFFQDRLATADDRFAQAFEAGRQVGHRGMTIS